MVVITIKVKYGKDANLSLERAMSIWEAYKACVPTALPNFQVSHGVVTNLSLSTELKMGLKDSTCDYLLRVFRELPEADMRVAGYEGGVRSNSELYIPREKFEAALEKLFLLLGVFDDFAFRVEGVVSVSRLPPLPAEVIEILDRDVETLGISARAVAKLRKLDISLIGDLVQQDGDTLWKSLNFGRTYVNEIKPKLDELGLQFNMDIAGRWPVQAEANEGEAAATTFET